MVRNFNFFSRKNAKNTKCLFVVIYKFSFATFAPLRETKTTFLSGLIFFTFIINLWTGLALGQHQRPYGKFLSDSIKIGQPVKFSLCFKHPVDMEVFFPDSSYDYSPFEFIDKQYFPTRSDSFSSTDSVVFTLMSFEIYKVQVLTLPVFIFPGKEDELSAGYPGYADLYALPAPIEVSGQEGNHERSVQEGALKIFSNKDSVYLDTPSLKNLIQYSFSKTLNA